jgi:ribonuclease HI
MRVIIEADGGARGNPGPAAYGAVLRDADSGRLLGEACETIGDDTNNVAEYRGLIAGLQLAGALAPQASVEVRMDSKLVIEQMAGRWKIKHPWLRPLAVAARALARQVDTWTWIPRADNKAADALVNAALDGKRQQPPPSLARARAEQQQTSDEDTSEGADRLF